MMEILHYLGVKGLGFGVLGFRVWGLGVDDINLALCTLRTLNYGNYGIFLNYG